MYIRDDETGEYWSVSWPVSYTHLDVYKRQMEACKQEARQFAKDFEEKTKMFPFFLRHADISRIEEIAIPLPVLIEQGDTQHFAAELVRCRSQLSNLSEMELPLAGNIL